MTLYVAAAMAALGAIGLAISTLTEHAIGAIAAIMILVVTSEVEQICSHVGVMHAGKLLAQGTLTELRSRTAESVRLETADPDRAITNNVPQLHAVGPYLPTHWWLSFDSLLRVPVDTATLLRGLLSFAVYAVLFGSFAWARFTSADVTS